ncbi:MAG: hypothetical protein AB8G05_15730 [Oligoflexales bacterium]
MENYQSNFHIPEFDPFPNSIVAVGNPYDIREKGYQVNHGKMDMTYVYETEPGSEQYFLVDMVGGDGIGGNSQLVVAENTEYQSLNLVFAENKSWHSWHVNENNVLVRANQNPTDNLKEEINLCGCGHRNEVSEAADDISDPIYSIGIFLLPGKIIPSFMDENEFSAIFKREYYKKKYVPAKGKKCEDYQWVC